MQNFLSGVDQKHNNDNQQTLPNLHYIYQIDLMECP